MARAGEGVDFSSYCQVIFNLATSGGGRTDEICKITACTDMGQFRSYIMPSKKMIRPEATEVNGLEVINDGLYENNVRVDTDPAETAINQFLNFLDAQRQSRKVILVAHKAHEFHGPRILRLVKRLDMMAEFQSRVAGIACTFRLFREVFPKGKPCSLEAIAEDIPGFKWEAQAAYNVTRKEQILLEVILHYGIENNITNYTESVKTLLTRVETLDRKASLEGISGLSPYMREKIAEAGIDYVKLQEDFQSGGDAEVSRLLQNIRLKPDVIDKILERLRVSVPRTPQPIE